jgi:ankyrin repeat protein
MICPWHATYSSSLPQFGFTALMRASVGGHQDVVRELLSLSADLNVQSKVSYTKC